MRRSIISLFAALAAAGLATACGPGDDDAGACSGLVAGDLVVTEVLADFDAPAGSSGVDEGREWFEIYNASSHAIELRGAVITHSRPDGGSEKSHVMGAVTIAAGQYLVLGNVLSDLAPAHVDYGYAASLGDLYNTDGGKLSIHCGATLVDEAVYDTIEAGRTRSLDGGGAPDYQANDLQTNWCDANETMDYEYELANFGTPGAANQDCTVVTPGMCTDGATMRATVPPQVGDLTITEVIPSPAGVSDTVGEWFEVLVNRDVDINDLALDRAGDSSNPNVLASSACKRVTAGTYLVFAKNDMAGMNGGLPRVDGKFTFLLVPGTATAPGDVRILIGSTELDSMSWTSSRNGRSLQLDAGLSDPADNDTAGNICDATMVYGTGVPQDRGTPGMANLDCGAVVGTMCLDTGTNTTRPIVKPLLGQLVLNEWMPDPQRVGDTAGEWFEVRATAAVDLNGLQAGTTTLGAAIVTVSGPCLRLDPAGDAYALFARNADPGTNGGLLGVDATESLTLTQTNGTLRIGIDGVDLDVKTWTESAPSTAAPCSAAASCGRSIMLDSDGTQCKAPLGTPPAGVPFYGTERRNFGTPGGINTPPECP